jgi:hypothetical protein
MPLPPNGLLGVPAAALGGQNGKQSGLKLTLPSPGPTIMGWPLTLGRSAIILSLTSGFFNGERISFPFLIIPARASLRSVGVNVEIKLTVNTIGRRTTLPP